MAYKLGMLLSMVFVMSVMLLGGDMVCISSIYASLDAISLSVSRAISKEGTISQNTLNLVASHDAYLVKEGNQTPAMGETVTYFLCRDYTPLILSKEEMTISIRRSAIVGYYLTAA